MASTNITTFPGIIKIAGELVGDGAGVSNVQTSNVIGLSDNVARIGTLETDLSDNSSRITSVESGAHVFSGIKTFEDDIILESNLRVQGDLLVANTVNMTVSDPIIELGSNNLNTGDIGFVMTRHGASESNVTMFYDETEDRLKIGYTLNGANDTVLALDSNALPVDIQGGLTVGGDVTMTDATSGSAAGPEFSLYRNQTGTNGDYLGQVRFDGKHDGGNDQLFGKITGKIKTATSGNESGIIETALVTDGSQRISVRHSGDLFHIKNGTDFQVGETANLYVDTSTSRVGVNTGSPAYPLDVHGSANVGALTATLTYSNAASNIVTWNSSTNEIIDSGLEKGFMEHPVAAMTDYHTYVEGHGTYEASASSYDSSFSLYPWEAFDRDTATRWTISTSDDNYNVSTGEWDQTAIDASPNVFTSDVGGTRYAGHWLQIKLPNAVTLSHSNIYPYTTARAPVDGVILGSNDGEAWYKLTEFSGKTYSASTWTRIDVNATTPYQYFRMCVTKNGGDAKLECQEWRLFAEKDVTKMENVHISGDLSSETLQTGYIKWPRKSLKANESEGYVASESSSFNSNFIGFHAFEDKGEYTDGGSPSWASGSTSFSSGAAAVSRTTGSDTFNHEWLQIQVPQAIQLSYFNIVRRDTDSNKLHEAPKNGRMYGSNDGVTWTKLVAYSDLTYVDYQPTRVDVQSTSAYKYFRLAVTNTTYTSGSVAYTAINELQLFEAATGVGAPPTSAKLQVHGSLGLAKGSSLYAGDSVVAEFPKHDRPLTKYPEVELTADAENVAGYKGYAVQYSGRYNSSYSAWTLFGEEFTGSNDEAPSGAWIDSSNTTYAKEAADAYNGVVGSVLTSVQSAGTLRLASNTPIGAWISLELPNSIKLAHIDMRPRLQHASETNLNNVALQAYPRDFGIWGYNGGVWVLLKTVTDHKHTGTAFVYDRIIVDSGVLYNKYAIVITRTNAVGGSNTDDRNFTAVGQLYFYGTEEGDESVDVVHRSVPNKPGQQQLAVYWDANDSNSYSFADSSNVYDLSGSGVTGTITGTNGFDAEYNAWVFDGSGDYISTTSSGLGTGGAFDHSFAFWFKINRNITNNDYVVTFGEETNDNMIAVNISGNTLIHFDNWGRGVITGDIVRLGTWYHVACTHTGSATGDINNQLIYVNGVRQTTSATGTGTLAFTSNKITIGARPGGGTPTAFLDGAVSNVRFFKGKALNPDQVRELYDYDAPRFGHRTNVVALHKGNLGVGVTAPTSRFEVAGREDLQEYPPQAMTGYETYMEGHGVFKVSASTYASSSYEIYFAFDRNNSTAWLSDPTYDGTTGAYLGSVTTGNIEGSQTSTGEWLQLELPTKIFLTRSGWIPQGTTRGPETGVILGSNNGSSWYIIHSFAGKTYSGTIETELFNGTSSIAYKYFRIIGNTIGAGARLEARDWKLYGTPAPSSLEDGHLTLGKALTTPRVSGHAAGAETPRAESLVVHYDTTLDGVVSGSGVVDTSGSGRNGTLNGATYSSSNRAFKFTGSSSHRIDGTHPLGTGDLVFSESLWVKVDTLTGSQKICGLGSVTGSTANGHMLAIQQTGGVVIDNYSSYIDSPSGAIEANRWHHIVYARTAGSANSPTNNHLWIDGVKQTISASGSNVNLNISDGNSDTYYANYLHVGGNPNGYFTGQISNFKVWNVALTADEVAAEFALGRTGKALNITDTAVCLGGTVPRAQLDVRGGARFGNRVDIGTNAGTSDFNPTALTIHELSNSQTTPALTLNRAPFDAVYGSSWQLIDVTTDNLINRVRQCSINLINYNTTGGGQANFSGRRFTGMGFSVSDAQGGIQENALAIKHNGNVGIGTASPATKLHIYDTSTEPTIAFQHLSSNENNSSTNVLGNLCLHRSHRSGVGNQVGIRSIRRAGTWDDQADMEFYVRNGGHGSQTAMVINSGGNANSAKVGIGTASPTSLLHIVNPSTTSRDVTVKILSGPTQATNDISRATLELHSDFGNSSGWGGYVEGRHESGVTHGLAFGTWTNGTKDAYHMFIKNNGNVGIGTTEPYAKLQVQGGGGSISSGTRSYFRYGSSGITTNTNSWGSLTIYGNGSIGTGNYFISSNGTIQSSDRRIKKNIVDADDSECLEVLRLLKPKKYEYKDIVKRGEDPVWGFIAQEVANVLPHATQFRQDFLPNIYELANVSSSNVITFTDFNTSNLEANATTIQVMTKDGTEERATIAEVLDERTIRVEEDLTDWIGSVDETGNVITEISTMTITPEEYEALEDTSGYVANISGYQNANVVVSVEEYNALEDTTGYEEIIQDYTKTTTTYPGTRLFVYGQEVDDFVFLKKEAIWTVATSALQEVDRQLQAEKVKVADLLARVEALENA